ncbi:MAG: histone deacetylase [Candidatus Aminicenantes bacterium]|nr:histone deacetylase [Candidatus Aminicenantes bacterium]
MPWAGFGQIKKNKKGKTAYLNDDAYLKHDTGGFHPGRPERLMAINKMVDQSDWNRNLLEINAHDVGLDIVSLVHDREYIEKVRRECETGYSVLSTGDTNICPKSYSVALKAVGGVLNAVDAVMNGKAKNAFCAVRPPGHHASQHQGMGFCVFNNIAIAARYAQKKHGLERILIADWDVHHGNGTQDIFYHDESVFFMSTHQYPWYPGTGHFSETGEGKGRGFTLNRHFPAGAGNLEILTVFKNDFLTAARDFKPDLTLISAGFDSRKGDPLGQFLIDDEGFRELTKIMLEISHINGNGRLLSILEGGYNLEGLSQAIHAHLGELSKA